MNKKLNITGKVLRALGYPEGPVISVAMQVMKKNFSRLPHDEALVILKSVLQSPNEYANDPVLGLIAKALVPKPSSANEGEQITLQDKPVHYNVFGAEQIEEGALQQMNMAARLPVAVAGALMPDAHSGYGLPIGGVLATEGSVIPYGVGVDIGCRMCLSIFPLDPVDLEKRRSFFTRELNEATLFGSGASFTRRSEHAVLDNAAFNSTALLKGLQDRAAAQLGSSGSGNHFVEFGKVQITHLDDVLGIEAGEYIGLLSHSGSRGLGANIANHYTRLAKEKRKLPGEAAHLAWLNLEEEEGMEYWIAMNLAGDYASACHHIIHEKIARQLGVSPIRMVENHHNFAWKEMWEGREVIVHRKGATPAGKNVLGIIPGSMTADGFIVKGKGESAALSSAAHGAGRRMSRTVAIKSITPKSLEEVLAKNKVKLIGGGLDEAPFAYKDIEVVMKSQQNLVDVVGRFTPKIVKMDSAPPRHRKRKAGGSGLVEGE